MTQANTKNLMTEGVIWKKILFFALPIFFGNLFQQLYNTADSLIVGNFLGSEALAAVSSSGNLIFLLVGFFNGIAVGAGVVICRPTMAPQQRTSSAGCAYNGGFRFSGQCAADGDWRTSRTADSDLDGNALGGIGFINRVFQNILCRIAGLYYVQYFCWNSAGGWRQPASLDLSGHLFTNQYRLGFDFCGRIAFRGGSAAFATIVSQLVSAALCWRRLLKVQDVYRIEPKKIRFNKPMLKLIIQYGLPSGLQNSIIGFANVVVQANINAFGQMAMAGCGAFSKIEGFGFLPITSFTMALTTFVGQNLGAREFERTRKGARFGILCSMVIAEVIGILIYVGAPWLIAAFNRDPQVIAYGTDRARTSALFFFLLAFSHCMAAILRGAGKSTVPMLVMLLTWCAARVTFINFGGQTREFDSGCFSGLSSDLG